MIVYKIQNNLNSKIYIGLTQNGLGRNGLKARIASHFKSSFPIGCALRKYGLPSFDISVIDRADDRNTLGEKEKYWIKYYNSRGSMGYNLTEGGDGIVIPSEELRKRWSIAQTGEGNGFFGKRHSEEAKKKMSKKKIGNKINLGKHHSPEAKAKMRAMKVGKPSNRKGVILSEETKQKMRKAHQKQEVTS